MGARSEPITCAYVNAGARHEAYRAHSENRPEVIPNGYVSDAAPIVRFMQGAPLTKSQAIRWLRGQDLNL